MPSLHLLSIAQSPRVSTERPPSARFLRGEHAHQERSFVTDLAVLLMALRLEGVAIRQVDELPSEATPIWCTHEQAAALGSELLVLREAEIAHEDLWALVHEAAHSLVPESQQHDETDSDLRAELLGPFLATELRLARALTAASPRSLRHLEGLIVARQIEDLEGALHGTRFSPPLALSPEEAAIVQGRLLFLQGRHGRRSQIEVLREHQAAGRV